MYIVIAPYVLVDAAMKKKYEYIYTNVCVSACKAFLLNKRMNYFLFFVIVVQ